MCCVYPSLTDDNEIRNFGKSLFSNKKCRIFLHPFVEYSLNRFFLITFFIYRRVPTIQVFRNYNAAPLAATDAILTAFNSIVISANKRFN